MRNNKIKNVVAWVLQVLLALQFVTTGLDKFTSSANWERRFDNWGYPDHFFYLVGAIEIILTFLLVIPKTLKFGLIGTIVLMIGATATHVIAQDGHFWGALITGLVAGIVLFLRKEKKQGTT